MNIAVCDDERVCTDLLSGYIKNCMVARDEDFNEFTIDTFASGEQLIDAYNLGKRYDLIFLDIKMKELNGFDSAKYIRTIDNKAMIVFVTSLADYIFNSFEYSPFWFLIKPVSEEKFRHVFSKALNEISKSKKGEYSFFTREYGLVTIEINNILYMESVLRKIVINTPTRQCSFYGGLTSEEQKLNKYDFIRIHKGYLVNMAHIQRINRTNVVLKNGAVLPLSEHRYKTVYDSFTSYLARC